MKLIFGGFTILGVKIESCMTTGQVRNRGSAPHNPRLEEPLGNMHRPAGNASDAHLELSPPGPKSCRPSVEIDKVHPVSYGLSYITTASVKTLFHAQTLFYHPDRKMWISTHFLKTSQQPCPASLTSNPLPIGRTRRKKDITQVRTSCLPKHFSTTYIPPSSILQPSSSTLLPFISSVASFTTFQSLFGDS